jgi:hypothetical protein
MPDDGIISVLMTKPPRCDGCGHWLRPDEKECGSCKRVADQQRERQMSAAEIGLAINDIANGRRPRPLHLPLDAGVGAVRFSALGVIAAGWIACLCLVAIYRWLA